MNDHPGLRSDQKLNSHRGHIPRIFHRLIQEEIITVGESLQQILVHLEEVCPTCKTEIEGWLAGQHCRKVGAGQVTDFTAVRWGRLERNAAARDARARRAARKAVAELADSVSKGELMVLDDVRIEYPEIAKVLGTPPEQLAFAESLIEHCRSALPDKPEISFIWASLACGVLENDCCSSSSLDPDLWLLTKRKSAAQKARALAYRANARRLQDDLLGAEKDFMLASSVMRNEGVTDLAVCGEVHGLAASLCRAQRHFGEALRFIDSALVLFRVSGHRLAALRASITAATVHEAAGDVERALDTTLAARSELSRLGGCSGELRLDLSLRHNEIYFLADLGHFEEAQNRLEGALDLYERFPDAWTQMRFLWVQGKISRGLGELPTAEHALAAARVGFIKAGAAYDTALVSLELALVYLEAGLAQEVQVLAASTVEVFRGLGIRREAFAAMRLFYIATLRDQATEELAQRLLRYYARARFSPGLALRDVG